MGIRAGPRSPEQEKERPGQARLLRLYKALRSHRPTAATASGCPVSTSRRKAFATARRCCHRCRHEVGCGRADVPGRTRLPGRGHCAAGRGVRAEQEAGRAGARSRQEGTSRVQQPPRRARADARSAPGREGRLRGPPGQQPGRRPHPSQALPAEHEHLPAPPQHGLPLWAVRSADIGAPAVPAHRQEQAPRGPPRQDQPPGLRPEAPALRALDGPRPPGRAAAAAASSPSSGPERRTEVRPRPRAGAGASLRSRQRPAPEAPQRREPWPCIRDGVCGGPNGNADAPPRPARGLSHGVSAASGASRGRGPASLVDT
ncbi:proline-rich protein HaeIII subfamily 1-like [Erinaceus europaeus]|uniref:Proline-rich protein HaeIII subfamily 1-like n=1 Tax=Erinaceus europaeus TaxID=9365 RepID=A0ABM3W5F6_ERIEU|nr:proline-rich protein HaeIII subfamily 1-like [Erinaceus europaeus]